MIDPTGSDSASMPASSWWLVDEPDVVGLVAQHAALRGLCDELEDCADRLPDRAAIACAVRITAAFAEVLCRHEVAEQAIVDRLLLSATADVLPGRLRHCHAADRLHTEDLHDALTCAARTVGPTRQDMSYMMRCLFDGCRRTIDFQEAGILLLARNRLTAAARLALLTSLSGAA